MTDENGHDDRDLARWQGQKDEQDKEIKRRVGRLEFGALAVLITLAADRLKSLGIWGN